MDQTSSHLAMRRYPQSAQWAQICQQMQTTLQQGHYEEAVLSGIDAVTRVIAELFPPDGTHSPNLPDDPVVL